MKEELVPREEKPTWCWVKLGGKLRWDEEARHRATSSTLHPRPRVIRAQK